MNAFGFSRKEILDAISDDRNLTRVFVILSLHYVQYMASRWHANYLDDRDKAAVDACKSITQLPEWDTVYWDIVNASSENDIYPIERGYHIKRTEPAGVLMTGAIFDMHATLRQTYAGLVLSFLMQYNKCERLSKKIIGNGILKSRDVHFFMI